MAPRCWNSQVHSSIMLRAQLQQGARVQLFSRAEKSWRWSLHPIFENSCKAVSACSPCRLNGPCGTSYCCPRSGGQNKSRHHPRLFRFTDGGDLQRRGNGETVCVYVPALLLHCTHILRLKMLGQIVLGWGIWYYFLSEQLWKWCKTCGCYFTQN